MSYLQQDVHPVMLRRPTPHDANTKVSPLEVEVLLARPFMDLVFSASQLHRQHFNPHEVQLSTLLSIKTGGCSEDCGYCPQSVHHETPVDNEPMLTVEAVREAAQAAKAAGASRFCMGAAWRGPKAKDLDQVTAMVQEVKALGMETCATLGLLKEGQAEQLKAAGLDYYNHNIDTAPEKYGDIISTRSFDDRLDTLGKVREAGLHVCCGGIVGMGETRAERAAFLAQLANLEPQPESVPINLLVQVEGTPLHGAAELDWTEYVRTVAVARLLMPHSFVRLSAGRTSMPEAMQALCFLAGANSIFYGDRLLTTDNPQANTDLQLMAKLDLRPLPVTSADSGHG